MRARTRDHLVNGKAPTLSVDLQENYRLAEIVAPHVDKIRYNPGHLHHHEKSKSIRDKVAYIADIAVKHDIALRVGVNCGSVDPDVKSKFDEHDSISPMLESASGHPGCGSDGCHATAVPGCARHVPPQ